MQSLNDVLPQAIALALSRDPRSEQQLDDLVTRCTPPDLLSKAAERRAQKMAMSLSAASAAAAVQVPVSNVQVSMHDDFEEEEVVEASNVAAVAPKVCPIVSALFIFEQSVCEKPQPTPAEIAANLLAQWASTPGQGAQ